MAAFNLELERLGTEQQALQREHTSVRSAASRREAAVKKLQDGITDLHAQKQVRSSFLALAHDTFVTGIPTI